MGLAMATNLQNHLSKTSSHPLAYFNRTLSRGDPLKAIGGVPAQDISSLAASSDIIFTCLSDDAALESTLDALITSSISIKDKLFVDTSTVHPDSSFKAHDRLSRLGATFIATPVFGATPVAAAGQLLFVLAGSSAAIDRITPYLVGVMARGVIRLSDDVRQSSLLKTAGNFLTAGMMELIAEAHVFAEKAGLPTEAVEELLGAQYGPLAHTMSRRLTGGAYCPAPGERPWSDLKLALKDVGHGVRCAESVGAKLHVGEVALGHLEEASQESRPLDSSSLYGVLRRQAGLDFETDFVKERDAKLKRES